MNILFVTGCFARNSEDKSLGGMAKAVYKSAKGMKNLGHDVRILVTDRVNKRWIYDGINIISIYAQHGHESATSVEFIMKTFQREKAIENGIKKLNEECRIDIIQYTGWFGIGLLHPPHSIPAVMRISSYTPVQLKNTYSKTRERILGILERRAAKNMNLVFAPGNIMAQEIQKDIKRRVGIIETPYIFEAIDCSMKIYNEKIKNKKYILFFGRMSIDKGIYVIRDALYEILKKHKDYYVVFAGSGSVNKGIRIEKELLEAAKKFQNRLIFLGIISEKELYPIIQNAEAILIPSIMDNFPNACAESMALGKVVIGSNKSSLEQFITDGVNGYLIENGNPISLAHKIEQAISLEENEKRKMEQNAVKRIEQLNIEAYSLKMERIYNSIICMRFSK